MNLSPGYGASDFVIGEFHFAVGKRLVQEIGVLLVRHERDHHLERVGDVRFLIVHAEEKFAGGNCCPRIRVDAGIVLERRIILRGWRSDTRDGEERDQNQKWNDALHRSASSSNSFFHMPLALNRSTRRQIINNASTTRIVARLKSVTIIMPFTSDCCSDSAT